MADEVSVPAKIFRLGEEKYYRLRFKYEDGRTMAAATATIEVYDSSGVIVTAFSPALSMTLTGTTTITMVRFITTGSGKNITAAGDYRVVVTLSFSDGTNTIKRLFQGPLTVRAKPS